MKKAPKEQKRLNEYMAQYRANKRNEELSEKIIEIPFKEQFRNELIPIFQSQTDQPVWEWSEENIRLPPGEAYQGAVAPDWSIAPEMKFILEMLKDPEVKEIYLMFSSQSSKTFTMFSMIGYMVAVLRENGMFVAPSITLKKRIKNRIGLVFEKSDIGYNKEKSTEDTFKFGSNVVNMALGSSPATLAEMPAGFVVMDEIDELPDMDLSPVQLARSRLRTKVTGKLVLGSTPKKLEGKTGILDFYNKSKKYVLEMKCPHCSEWSHFTHEHIMAPEGATYKQIAHEGLGFASCPANGCEISDEYHEEMVLSQKWVCLNPEEPPSHIGFYKPVWNTIFEDWSSVAAERLKTEEEGENSYRDFFNSWCAQPIDLSARTTDLDELGVKLERYKRGEIPAEVQALTLGVDVGTDKAWCVLLGWAENGKCFEIWDQAISWDDRDFSAIDRGLKHLVNDIGRQITYLGAGPCPPLQRAFIDAGYRTPDVYDFCRKNPLFLPLMGNPRATKSWVITKADPQRRYGAKSRGVNLYTIKSYFWQDILDAMLQRDADGPNSFNVPIDVHNRYINHMNAEVRRVKIDSSGNEVQVWEKVHRMAKNDMRDATIYGIVAGYVENLNSIRPPQPVEEKQLKPRTLASTRNQKSVAQSRRVQRTSRY